MCGFIVMCALCKPTIFSSLFSGKNSNGVPECSCGRILILFRFTFLRLLTSWFGAIKALEGLMTGFRSKLSQHGFLFSGFITSWNRSSLITHFVLKYSFFGSRAIDVFLPNAGETSSVKRDFSLFHKTLLNSSCGLNSCDRARVIFYPKDRQMTTF